MDNIIKKFKSSREQLESTHNSNENLRPEYKISSGFNLERWGIDNSSHEQSKDNLDLLSPTDTYEQSAV